MADIERIWRNARSHGHTEGLETRNSLSHLFSRNRVRQNSSPSLPRRRTAMDWMGRLDSRRVPTRSVRREPSDGPCLHGTRSHLK